MISYKIRKKTRMPTLTTFIQYSTGSLSHNNQTGKRNKRHQNWKRSKTVSLAGDMILNTENPKDVTKKLLELIYKFNEVVGYKINKQKYVALLYTNSELSEKLIE